eukprot:TRINITY_DN911_c11_g1_i1.p1 TRINITY_DN911_c11_g1~~TRINITY_DN911_c11_g1_i1.p1  ORF type:complete len:524 (+),score=123.21 TRINITY_DN911_c11_g1_i1:56-1573(+)
MHLVVGLVLVVVISCAEAVPANITEYMEEREAFIAQQAGYRMDGGERGLVGSEVQLNRSIVNMREELRKSMPGAVAMPLRAVKNQVEGTALWKVLHEMPKAVILHVHWSSTVSIEWLLKNGTHRPGCYIYWPAVKPANSTYFVGQGSFYSTPSEAPEGWVAAESLRASIPDFDNVLLTQYWDVYYNDTSINERVDPWGPFQNYFTLTGGVLMYKPVFEAYMRETISVAVRDWKVNFLELRALGYNSGVYDFTKKYTSLETTNIMIAVSNAMKTTLPGYLGMNAIWSEYRQNSASVIQASLEQAVFVKNNCDDKDFVIGWDLVGQEDKGHPLRYFLPQLLNYSGRIDYYFHAGETDLIGNGTTAENIDDAVLLGSKRIGHGLASVKLPLAANMIKEKGVTLEVCPVSNQGLQFVLDARQHPASALFDIGLPITINNDDPAILATSSSMGYDWWLAVMSWDIDLASIKAMVQQAIHSSSAPAATKDALYTTWAQSWELWVNSSISRF